MDASVSLFRSPLLGLLIWFPPTLSLSKSVPGPRGDKRAIMKNIRSLLRRIACCPTGRHAAAGAGTVRVRRVRPRPGPPPPDPGGGAGAAPSEGTGDAPRPGGEARPRRGQGGAPPEGLAGRLHHRRDSHP